MRSIAWFSRSAVIAIPEIVAGERFAVLMEDMPFVVMSNCENLCGGIKNCSPSFCSSNPVAKRTKESARCTGKNSFDGFLPESPALVAWLSLIGPVKVGELGERIEPFAIVWKKIESVSGAEVGERCDLQMDAAFVNHSELEWGEFQFESGFHYKLVVFSFDL